MSRRLFPPKFQFAGVNRRRITLCREARPQESSSRGKQTCCLCASKLLGLCAGFRSLDHNTQVSVWPVKATPQKQFRWGWVVGWHAGQSGSLCWVHRTIRVLNNGRHCLPTSGKEIMIERGDLGSFRKQTAFAMEKWHGRRTDRTWHLTASYKEERSQSKEGMEMARTER